MIIFAADVPHNEHIVEFELKSKNDNSYRFENAEHDFPQYITYFFISSDTIEINLGTVRDQENPDSKVQYRMKKVD